MTTSPDGPWTPADSADLYNVAGWGRQYFSVGERGHVVVHPGGPGTPEIDLKDLVDEVRERGIAPPLLVRFSEILKARVVELNEAFARAIAEYGYQGAYCGVFPIKVNQDRYLVERLLQYGRPYHYGLEAGSKPELLAVMAMLDDPEALIVCNGYKDQEYIETALLASKLGRTVIPVIEKASELSTLIAASRATGVAPTIGVRSRLSARGAGHWEASGGDRAKFGLSSTDLLQAVELLRAEGMLQHLKLVHFHLGSQISDIRSIKGAIREAAWTYVNLVEMGAPLEYLDVGGGLGVDYQGTRTDDVSSMNYSLQEYVNDVVYGVQQVCDQRGVAHPVLVSESGRATVAHHAVLVFDVLGVVEYTVGDLPSEVPADAPTPLVDLFDAVREGESRPIEAYHDALVARDDCRNLFNLGHLTLAQRGLAEQLFLAVGLEVWRIVQERYEEPPEQLADLPFQLADTYFCNFSVFQSMPDSWAIDQVFPVMPIHRLDERPERRGILADITCDSDGKLDRFIDRTSDKRVLELHPLERTAAGRPAPYYLAAFLVGAYQEILGDLHNLFGDTNTVNVSLDPEGGYHIDDVIAGDTVTDVLRYVSYSRRDLVARLRRYIERAIKAKTMQIDEGRALLRMYEEGLAGYTYLEHE